MKNTMKIFLVIALFSSMAFAGDINTGGFTGDINTGGKTCPQGTTCLVNGDESKESTSEDSTDSIFEIVSAYLDSIF